MATSDPVAARIGEKLKAIKNIVLVLSGKGGVGKSTFSSQLAFTLASMGKQVGLVDIDLCGPSIPRMLGLTGQQVHRDASGWVPVRVKKNISVMSIAFMLPNDDDAVIWRGPKKNGLIQQFFTDVNWGPLDYLIIDTPPGTSDEHISIMQYLAETNVKGSLVVTTPQEVAMADVRKELNFCKKVSLPVLGLVENMSGYTCSSCKKRTNIFLSETSTVSDMATKFSVPFLGAVPLDSRLATCCEEGVAFAAQYPDALATKPLVEVVNGVVRAVGDTVKEVEVEPTASADEPIASDTKKSEKDADMEGGSGSESISQEARTDVPDSANVGCPGTKSEQAGKADACSGCPNQSACASGAGRAEDTTALRVAEKLQDVKNVIMVLSGKGGVGKSTFSSQLAFTLAEQGKQVGLLDIDLCGPSIPRMLGVKNRRVHQSASGWSPVWLEDNLGIMSIAFMLPSEDDAVIWRGPKKNGLIQQFLTSVDWGELDYLIIDTPPGTSDEHISMVQFLKKAALAGAVVVTTPQEVAMSDVRKEINFCAKTEVNVLGVVENMSGFVCPHCKASAQVFPNGSMSVADMAAKFSVPFLGRVPLDPEIAKCCENGEAFASTFADSPSAAAVLSVVKSIQGNIGENNMKNNATA